MKRIFICADRSFPRGDAGANRILYIAKALKKMNWDVLVVSIGKNEEKHLSSNKKYYVYEGIKYHNIKTSSQRIVRSIEHNFIDGIKVINKLKQYKIDKNDKVLIYSSSFKFTYSLLKFLNRINVKLACDVVEWHQPFQFKLGKYDIRYILYRWCFDKLFPSSRNIISISNYLTTHFNNKGCNTITLPIYVDIKQRDNINHERDNNVLNLIYPGNPYRKDSLITMLKAINMLDKCEKKRIVLHLTGVSKSHLYKCIPNNEQLLDDLIDSRNVVVHSWMEYDELIKLYNCIDFAFIARPINIVTKANFPSKIPELMEKGIPPITNKVGDIINYLSNEFDSILYDGEDLQNCANAIKKALNLSNEEIYTMHKNARNTAIDKFDYNQCSHHLDEFFENLL